VTWVGIIGVIDNGFLFRETATPGTAVVGAFAAMAIVSWLAVRRRRDIYPLAVAMGSFIIVVLCSVPRLTNHDEGLFLLLALWLIVSSTLGGKLLMSLMRRWRAEAAA
jgi:hypothetical protein